jgi:hypothetical protein
VLQFEADSRGHDVRRDEGKVVNYIGAMKYGLLKELHKGHSRFDAFLVGSHL